MEKYWLEPYQEFIQEKKLNEGLIKSVSLSIFKNKLNDLLKDINHEIETKNDMVQLYLDFTNLNKYNIYKKILSLSNILGYYIIRIKNNNDILEKPLFYDAKNFEKCKIFFVKNNDEELNDIKYLYHLTLKDIWENNISKNGIKPKESYMVAQNDKSKIYLTTEINYNFINEKINYYLDQGFDKYYDIYNWVSIEIIKTNNMRIFKDIKMNNSYYTLEPIPKSSINKVINI